MRHVLEKLIELQKLDSQLQQLESLKGDLPQQVSRLQQEFGEAERTVEEKEKKLQVYQKERGMAEMEIKGLEGKQKKYQNQLFEVKTNREYDAVTHEIEAVKANIDKKECRLLELMEFEEETKKSLESTKKEIEKLRKQLSDRKEELKKRLAETEKDEAAYTDKKDKIVRRLEPRISSTYERIRKAKNGLAVVPVARSACGGCFKTLPPQRILEVRQMNRIYLCEVCGRILVWDEKESENSE